jgi:fructose/tagatose bisphosphate aldolase
MDLGHGGDFSHLSLAENIADTKIIVEYAHARNVAVEGEVGVIAGVEDDIASDVQKLASFEETMHYIRETGVDAVAPACGTAHGTYKSEPCLNYDLIRQLGETTETALVLHGGTGLSQRTVLGDDRLRHRKDQPVHRAQGNVVRHADELSPPATTYLPP